jgi:hypothetical protein
VEAGRKGLAAEKLERGLLTPQGVVLALRG